MNDARFSSISKDPRFKRLPKKDVKIKVDNRFKSMFADKNFQLKSKVDKRGRPVRANNSEDLKRYYAISDSESEEELKVSEDSKSGDEFQESNDNPLVEDVIKPSKKDKKFLTPDIQNKLKDLAIDYARGEGRILSESSSDDDSTDDEDPVVEFEHGWGELDKDADATDEPTKRLAICNMDWDRINATDLMVLFHSFLPSGRLIHSITVYPSDYGVERMKEEEEKGPSELTEKTIDDGDEEANEIQMEKLRKYQLNRLKYYYAVMVCDTTETANTIYTECDGLEYESSMNKLDLRFIPDDTRFDQEPRETCTSLPNFSTYKPRLFTTTALTQAKVELTWDETDPNRKEIVKSIHSGKFDDQHLKQYLACSSSSDEESSNEKEIKLEINTKPESEKTVINKYKALLAEIESSQQKKKNDVNLEVTWNLKLEKQTSEKIQKNTEKPENPFQQYLEKRREKKKKKKEASMVRKQTTDEEGGSADSAFSDDEIPSDIDMDDPYFKEERDGSKNRKKNEKKKKVSDDDDDEEAKSKKAELELLMLGEEKGDRHFSLKKIEENENPKKKKKFKKVNKRKTEETNVMEDDFKIDVKDERFSAVYTSHHFNIDPSDPQFRKTKATKELIDEKLRRREDEPDQKRRKVLDSSKKKDAELSVLVKSIKRKTAEVQQKKNR